MSLLTLCRQPYLRRVLATRPSSLISYPPLWEGSGTVAYDQSGNNRNALITGFDLAQPGIGDGRTSALLDGTNDYGNWWTPAMDAHGSNHLTRNGAVTQATGKVGNAAQFVAASSTYLSIVDNADLSMGDIDFTVGAWVYLDSKGADRGVLGKYTSGDREYLLYFNSGADRFTFIVRNTANSAQGNVNADNLGSPSLGTWYFVVGWHDSVNDVLGISVNAGTANTTAWSQGCRDSTNALEIGRFVTSYWEGRIDSAFVSKRILTSGERASLYNSGNGKAYADLTTAEKVSLVSWWELNESPIAAAFNGNEGSFGCWCKVPLSVWTAGTARRIFQIQVDANNRIFAGISATANTLSLSSTSGGTAKVIAPTGLSYIDWFHVAITWSKTADELKMYLNGLQVESTVNSLGTFTGTITSAILGASSTAPASPWSGYLAHPALWSAALTAGEVANLARRR